MVNAKKLIILTNVDGVFTGNPNSPDSRLIPEIHPYFSDEVNVISPEKSHFGRGGMLTKFKMAKKTASLGIPVHISNGKKDDILLNIFSGKSVGTVFTPDKQASTTKKWLAHAHSALSGFVVIDSGAVQALKSANPTSLLFVGIKHVEGHFKKGDIIEILDENTHSIGIGKTMFDSEKSRELKGKKGQKECIHYDYLYLNP
jgi:glutamate 5-kinase